MTVLYHRIQQQLDHAQQPDSLRDLFCTVLNLGTPASDNHHLPRSGPEQEDLTVHQIARLGALPVFSIDWPAEKLPTVAQRRRVQHALSRVALEHILCYVSRDGRRTAIIWARNSGHRQLELRTLSYEVGTSARTTIERLSKLACAPARPGPSGNGSAAAMHDRLYLAFDAEAVRRQFFASYRACFEQARRHITGIRGEACHVFIQKLCNRLVFLAFLERTGWLTFQGRSDYLRALWEAHQQERQANPGATFYQHRLKLLFFAEQNTPDKPGVESGKQRGGLSERVGQVLWLSGGLFAEESDDRNEQMSVPDAALEGIITDLCYAFTFTVSESTPFDIEIAVDPEMLGKIFEELVTRRHERGSYYTPRAVVAFMCREGLKGHLAARLPYESREVIARFVDQQDAALLRNPTAAFKALQDVRVCDPACGSGAHLIGMFQEILHLRAVLSDAHGIDATTICHRKLEIIRGNLYGVDIDPLAVTIARLRLWLSLAMEHEGDKLPPLPGLDDKLAVGDSLLAPAPFGDTPVGMKQELDSELFCWQIDFAEVFAESGFDIVIANPPYVRQERIKDIKPALKSLYPQVYTGTSDLYVYFYARALQVLRAGGMLVFISPNKWLRADYGRRLKQHLAEQTCIHSITDFGELPVFKAATFPMIIVARKAPRHDAPIFTPVKTLEPPYPDVLLLVQEQGQQLPTEAIQGENWLLSSTNTVSRLQKMEASGTALVDYISEQLYAGIKTGLNRAFWIDTSTREELIAQDPASIEIIKPLVVGDDIRRWQLCAGDRWLILTYAGVDMRRYPAILDYLSRWKPALEKRSDQGNHWWELRPCAYYHAFEKSKIIFPDIGKEPRFTLDTTGMYVDMTAFIIPTDDFFLAGVLNSSCVWSYLSQKVAVLGDARKGGRLRLKRVYMQTIPIPAAPATERQAIAVLAQQCVDAHGQGAQVAAWEAEIDARVARLYRLNEHDLEALKEK